MSERRYFLDGCPVSQEAFVVHGEDDGFLRGLAVFETMRSYNHRVFRAGTHLERLLNSAKALEIPTEAAELLEEEISMAVKDFPWEARVQITLTVGGRRLMHVVPLNLNSPGASLRVITRSWEPPEWLTGRVKHCSRAAAQIARRRAKVDEVFWVGRDGCLTEGARSNIFAVVDGVLVTPPDDGRILCGVTRGALLDAGRTGGVAIEEAPLRPSDAMTELYASSTLRDLSPVVEVDGIEAPGAGPLGEKLSELFHAMVEKECGL